MKPPCKNCAERQLGCHSDCSKYRAYKDWQKEHNDRIRKEKEVVNSFMAFRAESKEKMMRAKGMK